MKYLLFLVLSLSIMSCSSKWDSSQLHGKWNTISWKVMDSDKTINAKMDFNFQSDGRYELDYGSKIEKGKYWIYGEYLHTVEDGKSEKRVKIINLTSDQFSFEMNRGGTIEIVVLKKEG